MYILVSRLIDYYCIIIYYWCARWKKNIITALWKLWEQRKQFAYILKQLQVTAVALWFPFFDAMGHCNPHCNLRDRAQNTHYIRNNSQFIKIVIFLYEQMHLAITYMHMYDVSHFLLTWTRESEVMTHAQSWGRNTNTRLVSGVFPSTHTDLCKAINMCHVCVWLIRTLCVWRH